MNRIIKKKFYWIGGCIAAFSGVAMVKLIAPALSGLWQHALQAAGYIFVLVGLLIIGIATRRPKEEAFVNAPEKSNNNHKPNLFRRMP
ncbi:MAG: hypothetical protein ABFD50_22905 [Smithella sp.]